MALRPPLPPSDPGGPRELAFRELALVDLAPEGAATGPPVLLLHGITGSRHYWDRLAPRIARRRRVIAPDLLGFARSPKPEVRYDVPGHAEAVRGLLERFELAGGPVDVVAHSLGALVTLEKAVRWPGLIRRAVLISLPCHADREDAHRHFLRGSANYRRLIGKASLAATLASWRDAGPAMALRYLLAFSPRIAADSRRWTFHSLTSTVEHSLLGHRVQDTAARLAAIPTPLRPRLLLVHGARDQVAPLGGAREVATLLGAEALHVVPGTGHHPLRTHPRRLARTVEAFLDAGEAPAAPGPPAPRGAR